MQAIHNPDADRTSRHMLFQRAKIQDKCKQFTTTGVSSTIFPSCFKEQRYKINASNSQQLASFSKARNCCFKEQRYKINASNSQLFCNLHQRTICCFKEQRYKINASNSQHLSLSPLAKKGLFQRAKIQDKCKQFTTILLRYVFQ